jgi:hypothetical protein
MWSHFNRSYKPRFQHSPCAISLVALLMMACGGGNDAVPDANTEPDAPPAAGTLSLGWLLTDGVNPLTCAQIAGSSVSIRATPSDGGSGVPGTLSCDSGSGSLSLPPGTFDVVVTLRTSTLDPLTPPQQFDNVLIVDGQETPLGTLTFQVVANGNVEFTVATSTGDSNCADFASGGAGMTDIYVEFRNELGQCLLTDFVIAAGANNPGGTFSSDCAGTTLGACIERDQAIRVEAVTSGPSSMVFTGYKSGVECFSRNSQFIVPGGELTTSLIPQQLVKADIPACDP